MTIHPSPYEILRAIQDQQAVMLASQRATDRLVAMLAGMLDKSAPDPLMAPGPLLGVPAAAAPWQPPQKPKSNRPMRRVEVGGKPVMLSEARAKMLEAMAKAPRTTEDIVALGLSTSADAVRKAFVATNFEFTRLGIAHRIKPIERLSRVGPRGGSILPRYALVGSANEIADPDLSTAVQSEAAAGASPDSEASDSASGNGDGRVTAQDAPFAMSSGAGEGPASPADPAPAADEPIAETGDDRDGGLETASCPTPSSAKASLDSDAGPAPAGNAKRPAQSFTAGDERKVQGIPGASDRALDLWSTTDMLRGEIGRLIGVSRTTVNNYLIAARAELDPRVIAGDSRRTPTPPSDDALPIVPASPPAAESPPAAPPVDKPIPAPAPLPARTGAIQIEPGDLLAVDIKAKRVQTARGSYEVGGVNLARALDFMKAGHLFGLDVIAKRAGWPTADVAKTALGFEKNRLAQHGVDLWMDRFNARLRESA